MVSAADSVEPSVRTPFRLGHRPALDGLRGVAILLVMIRHSPLIAYLPEARLGVDIFFVLSGFLITALLCEERAGTGAICLPAFFRRRAVRLLPALALFLIASIPFNRIVYGPESVAAGLVDGCGVLFYYYNWSVVAEGGIRSWVFGHTWSLAIEEQFYLVWPAVLLLLFRSRRGRMWAVLATSAGIVVPLVLRLIFATTTPDADAAWLRIYYGTDTRADGLFAGALLALIACGDRLPRGRWSRLGLRVAALVAVAFLAVSCVEVAPASWYQLGLRFSLIALASVAIIAALLCGAVPLLDRVLRLSPLTALGRLSYGLYLWHIPVNIVLIGDPNAWGPGLQPRLSIALAAFDIALAIVWLSYRLVERPCLQWNAIRMARTRPIG